MRSLEIGYDPVQRTAILQAGPNGEEAWFGLLLRSLGDRGVEIQQRARTSARIPWGQFLGARTIIGEVRAAYGLTVTADARASELLQEARGRLASFEAAKDAKVLDEASVLRDLAEAGFIRELTDEQRRNVRRIASLPSAATFSVPGAGKTTEALAYYSLRAKKKEPLLVIAPKNALGAWDEQLGLCFGDGIGRFTRLRGGDENIAAELSNPKRFMIITYQQLARDRVPKFIADFLATHRAFVFVDESHRIKGRGITSSTVRDLAFLPAGKLILTGTPMPQAVEDLLPQFEFLYPEVAADRSTVVEQIRAVFVRTTKKELRLPEVQRLRVGLSMLPAQRKLYDLLKTEVARQAELTLSARDRSAFRALGRSVMRVLQLVSNPALLVATWDGRSDLLSAALEEGDSPKLQYACRRARSLASQGRKVLLWSAFRENVETLAFRLSDLGAVFIHGSVDAGHEDDPTTREGRIRLFHDSAACQVMVANPAAAGEGISLHRVCHNAIYVDRTYNAAHYLQSEDRIHRIGTTVSPVIEIVECDASIDQSVAQRLEAKAQQMADVLDDASLRINPRTIAFEDDDDEDGDEDPMLGMDINDVRSILATFQ